MTPCALCSLPLTPPSVRSQVLEGDFHEACYQAAWKLKDVRAQQDEGWQVEAWCSAVPVHQGVEMAEMVMPKKIEAMDSLGRGEMT